MRVNAHERITGGEADKDGAAASSSRSFVPAQRRGPIPNRRTHPRASAAAGLEWAMAHRRKRGGVSAAKPALPLGNGVAHEAPLPTASRVWKLAQPNPHARSRPRMGLAALARQPVAPPSK